MKIIDIALMDSKRSAIVYFDKRLDQNEFNAFNFAATAKLRRYGWAARIAEWMYKVFAPHVVEDVPTRAIRFGEESMELMQACGLTLEDVLRTALYVYGRPVGEQKQEVGGVMLTLGALCNAAGINPHHEMELELERVNDPAVIEVIKAKQAGKPVPGIRSSAGNLGSPSPEERDHG